MMKQKDLTSTRTSGRRRSLGVAGAGAVALGLLLTACHAPVGPAASTFDAWKAGNKAAAAKTAEPAAVDQLFAKPWSKLNGWFFSNCTGVAGSTYCTWIDNTEGRLELKLDNQKKKVVSVKRIGLGPNIVAGRFFHAYRQGKPANAAPYGTHDAVVNMFAVPYNASKHWTPAGCDDVGDVSICTWYSDPTEAIELRVHDATKTVVQVNRFVPD